MESEEPNLFNPSPVPPPPSKKSNCLFSQERHNVLKADTGSIHLPANLATQEALNCLKETLSCQFLLKLFITLYWCSLVPFFWRYRLQFVALLHLIRCQVNMCYVCLFVCSLTHSPAMVHHLVSSFVLTRIKGVSLQEKTSQIWLKFQIR